MSQRSWLRKKGIVYIEQPSWYVNSNIWMEIRYRRTGDMVPSRSIDHLQACRDTRRAFGEYEISILHRSIIGSGWMRKVVACVQSCDPVDCISWCCTFNLVGPYIWPELGYQSSWPFDRDLLPQKGTNAGIDNLQILRFTILIRAQSMN